MRLLERVYRWLSRSLANQLLFTYLLVLTIALVSVSLWALIVVRTESISDLRNALEVEAVNLGLEIDNDLALDSLAAKRRIKQATDRHAQKLGLWITVVDDEGHVIVDSGAKEQREGENISNQPEINDALAGIAAIYTRSSYVTNSEWLFVAYPVRAAGKTAGVIRVGLPLNDVNQRLHRTLIIFLEIILATAIVTIAISLWLAKRVTLPIRSMSDLAQKIAKSGDITEYVPVTRWDEIGELGLSFNQMIGRLKEQERLRQEFISNASHELKTPTMAIGSVVEALQAGAVNDPELRLQFLGSLEKLVERQSSLLGDLLDIARLDAGLDEKQDEDVNLDLVINNACEEIAPQVEKKKITFSNLINDDVIVPGNASQLERAFVNLLTNAVNYTPEAGSVTLSTRVIDSQQVEIRIQDTGNGIDPADLPYIFDRFYRADKARTRSGGGTGLGLAITREIIARHHGTVDVESALGKGAVFTVRLPVARINQSEVKGLA